MSVDPNEYDVGELRAIAGVDDDASDAAESDAGDTVDAGVHEGAAADAGQDDEHESDFWEAVPSADEDGAADEDDGDDPWVSVPDADDTTGPGTDTPGETTTADAEPGPGADTAGSGSDREDGGSTPFTVDLEPSKPSETVEPAEADATEGERPGDASDPTPEGTERETGGDASDPTPEGTERRSDEPDDHGGQVDTGPERSEDGDTDDGARPDAEDPETAPDSASPSASAADPLGVLLGGAAEPATDESGDGVPDSPATPTRIEAPSGEPSVDTRSEIAEALTATTRGGTTRITRDEPAGPGEETVSPGDTLRDGVPADEQVTVDGVDGDEGREEWTVETSAEAVEALYGGADGDTGAPAGDDGDDRTVSGGDAEVTADDLKKADAIDFGFEEDDADAAGRRLSEQVADVLYAGEDPPE